MKTDGLLPLGVCDSGDDEDVQGSTRDFYGNHVDAGVFLDSVAFKLERCGLGMCERKEKNPFVQLIEFHSLFFFFFGGPAPPPRKKRCFQKKKKAHPLLSFLSREPFLNF